MRPVTCSGAMIPETSYVYVVQDPDEQLTRDGPLVNVTVHCRPAEQEVGGAAANTACAASNPTAAKTAQETNTFLNRIATTSPFVIVIVIVSVAEGATTLCPWIKETPARPGRKPSFRA